ncbi:hypothetical protein AB6813_11795 [bacterium RCC_150]
MDINGIQEAATRKLEEEKATRVQAAVNVAEATKLASRLRNDLKEAEKQESAAWRAALTSGWTETELKSFGLTAPTLKLGGRPKTSTRKKLPVPAQDTNE